MTSVPSTSTQNGTGPSTSTCPCPDPDIVAVLTMRKAMGSLLDNVGFTHAHEGPLNVITDVAVRFMEKICKEVKLSSEYCGRSQPAMDDLTLAFNTMKFDKVDFHTYLSQVSSVTPIAPLPAFPVEIPDKSLRINGYKTTKEERKSRPPHIPRFLPGIRPTGEEREEKLVPAPLPSTSVHVFDKHSASFEKSKNQYLTRFEGDVPGFFGLAATSYGMKKTDKDKNPPVLPIMKGERRTDEEKRRIENEERNKRIEIEKRSCEETNGIHHKFKKHKDKEKTSRPPSTAKGINKPPKEKTPHKLKRDEKSRTNTPNIRENAPILHPEIAPSTSHYVPFKQEKMERDSPKPLLSLNLFDDPAEEADIPLPRTPGNRTESPDDEALFFDPDPFGRMSFNAISSATSLKSTPTMKEEEKRRKEEKRARKEEKRARKAAEEETARIEKEKAEKAEKEAMKEARRVAAREDAKERERDRNAAREQQRAERERKEKEERERAEEKRKEEAEVKARVDAKREEFRIKAALIARQYTEANEAKDREREAKEKKRKEEKERQRRLQTQMPTKTETLRRSETPRVETPKPRELEAIRAEEDKEDSSTIPFVMEDETNSSAPTGPTSFPLNMSLNEPIKEERTVTPIKIKKHVEERDGEKTKKKHKKDKKEREDDRDSFSNRDEDEKRREKERKKAKKREKREKEDRERMEKEKADQSPIQDKIDPVKSGLKLTIKLGGASSYPVAPPSFSTTPIPPPRAPSSTSDHPASLFKLKIKTPIDPSMESATSSFMPVSTPPMSSMAPSKPRPVTKAELKATPASMPQLFKEETTWKHKQKKHKHSKASVTDSSSSSDDEERREREKRREKKREKERIERERKEKEERREKEREREKEKEREREREKEREKEKEKERIERERQDRIKQEKEKERLEKEKREREREREREKEKKKKQTAFDLALQASTEKKKKRKEEPVEVIWICPVCSVAYVDGAEMIGCDCCDSWFHWQCCGIHTVPEGDNPWFCERCTPKNGELPNYGKNKKKCTHWSGQYMDWNIKKPKKSRDYE